MERLIHRFRASGLDVSAASKLSVLLDIERIHDPRIVPFLLQVVADDRQTAEVRIHVLRRLRNGLLSAEERCRVAGALSALLASNASESNLRLQAALALSEFTDFGQVPALLGVVALKPGEPIDLRYAAFTSLEHAGPTTESVTALRQLTNDDTLGPSARSLLLAWRLSEPA